MVSPSSRSRWLLTSLLVISVMCHGCYFDDSLDKTLAPTTGAGTGPLDMSKDASVLPDSGMLLPEVDGCTPLDTPTLCTLRGTQCGPLQTTDNCGLERLVECGACPAGERCDESLGLCACVPQDDMTLCEALGLQCGSARTLDNCGQTREIDCSECQEAGVLCEANMCSGCAPESNEDFCERQGKNCGLVSAEDHCGQDRVDVACGVCDPSEECGTDNVCACVPESDMDLCGRLGKTCGTLTAEDNCGQDRDVECGDCPSGSCLPDNTCEVCQPETDRAFCRRLNTDCGDLNGEDNCGTMRSVSCGSCSGGEVCQSGQCVCPAASCGSALECGTVSNACGASQNCGSCSNGETCVGNICECPTPTCQPGACGTISNACGATRNCGSCANASDTCSNNTCVCQPESDNDLCQFRTCGNFTATDRCGVTRNVNCGSCSGGDICNNNFCCPKLQQCIEP